MPSRQRADFRVAVTPRLLGVSNEATNTDQLWACDELDLESPYTFVKVMSSNSTVLQCELAKSSYNVDFDFTNGEQSILTERRFFVQTDQSSFST